MTSRNHRQCTSSISLRGYILIPTQLTRTPRHQYVRTEEFRQTSVKYHLFYMTVLSAIFRLRMYVAWKLSESICISARLGAYPAAAKPANGAGPTDLAALDRYVVAVWRSYAD